MSHSIAESKSRTAQNRTTILVLTAAAVSLSGRIRLEGLAVVRNATDYLSRLPDCGCYKSLVLPRDRGLHAGVEKSGEMHVGRIFVLPSSNKLTRSLWRTGFKLSAACLAALLSSPILAAQAAPQAPDPAAPASAQQPAQSAPPAPSEAAQPENSQPAAPRPARPAMRPVRHRVTLDDHVKALAKSLDLNEAQQAAIKKILERRQQEILRLRQDASISGDDRTSRLRALQDQTVEKIRGVLNDEQKKKYNPLASRQAPPAPDQKSVEDWMKATTPH